MPQQGMMYNPMMGKGAMMNPQMGGKGGAMPMMGGPQPMMGGGSPMMGMMPNPQMMQMMQQKGGNPQMQMMQQKGMPGMMPQSARPPMQQAPAAAAPAQGQAFTASTLAATPPAVQKQMLGEKLFPLIAKIQPDMAGKVTGMMLEMDNSELLMLLESEAQLRHKVNEALGVLGGKP